MKVVTLLSGGLDSTSLLYWLAAQQSDTAITALSFNYGQRHGARELQAARDVVLHFQTKRDTPLTHDIIDLRSLTHLLEGSALTDPTIEVPDGHYTNESMRVTVVPNRNMMMLAIATSVAVAQGAQFVAFGAHAGDHAIYPDCRRDFVYAFEAAARIGNAGFINSVFQLAAPYLNATKADIVRWGTVAGAPFELTWSCYKGQTRHCGSCATCIERREAFELARVDDPTEYADPRPWQEIVSA